LPNLRYPEAMDVNWAPSGIVIVIGLWRGLITVSRCSNFTGKYMPEEPVSEIRLCEVIKGVTELILFIELQALSTNKEVSIVISPERHLSLPILLDFVAVVWCPAAGLRHFIDEWKPLP
jgi:hypothetical protein